MTKPRTKPITNWDSVPVILDTGYVAALLAVTPDRVSRMCKKGILPGHKVGRDWRIFKDELISFIKGE